MIRKIDHIAVAVTCLEDEIKRYEEILGLPLKGTEVVEAQKVRVAFFQVGDVSIELMEPTAADSPISAFLEKRGGGIHHIAFEVDDIVGQIAAVEEKGARMLNPEPRNGAHDSLVAFAHPKSFSGVLLEFTQRGR